MLKKSNSPSDYTLPSTGLIILVTRRPELSAIFEWDQL